MSPAEELRATHLVWARGVAVHLAQTPNLPGYVDRDDLIQDALVGFLQACDRYEVGHGTQFRSFAWTRMRGAILDRMRVDDHLSREARRQVKEHELARGDNDRVAESVEVTVHGRTFPAAVASSSVRHQLAPWDDDGDLGWAKPIREMSYEDPSYDVDPGGEVAAAVRLLDARHRQVIEMFFDDGMSLRQIGERMGVTESRISQMKTLALERLRDRLTAPRVHLVAATPAAPVEGRPFGVTAREAEVLARIAAGGTDGTVAADMCVSAHTVKTHVKHCLAKLSAANRTHAVAVAIRRGII